jgi:hypothetical protein
MTPTADELRDAGAFGRRFIELSVMYERTSADESRPTQERFEEMTRLLHKLRRRMDESVAILEADREEPSNG